MWRFAADIAHPISIRAVVEVDPAREPVLALVGPNGAGKSTLLQAWAGFMGGTQGDLFGPAHRRPMAWVPQEPTLLPHRTVGEQVQWILRGPLTSREDLMQWVQALDLDAVLALRPGFLSGGQQQRAALLRALAANPNILALDEALNQIDPSAREGILGRLATWAEADPRRLLILTTHQFYDVAHIASQVLVMDRGRILRQGSPGVIMANPDHWAVAALVGYAALIRSGANLLAVPANGIGAEGPGVSLTGIVLRRDGLDAILRVTPLSGRTQFRVSGAPVVWSVGDVVTVYATGVSVEE